MSIIFDGVNTFGKLAVAAIPHTGKFVLLKPNLCAWKSRKAI